MMNYEEMSDFQINEMVLVATKTNGECHEGSGEVYARNDRNILQMVDYCNNPSDAWSIIMEYQISITKYEGLEEWDAHGGGIGVDYDHCIISYSDCSYSNKNPLRAAMIVFLMMQEPTE